MVCLGFEPGPQDGRSRQNQGAMAALLKEKLISALSEFWIRISAFYWFYGKKSFPGSRATFIYDRNFLPISAIHGGASDAVADVAGLEGGDRAVAGGAARDVDGLEGDAGRPRSGTNAIKLFWRKWWIVKLQLDLNARFETIETLELIYLS